MSEVEGVPVEETQEQDGPEPDETPTPLQPPDEDEEAADDEEQERLATEQEQQEQQEQEGGPAQALSEKEIEKRNQALDKEAIRHAKRVAEIVGDDIAALVPCELCAPIIPGFHFTFVPDEQRAAVMLALGLSSVGQYEKDRHSDACGDCNGWGVVATGSKVQGQEALTCMNCQGRGWMGDRAAPIAPVVPAPPNGETEPATVQPVPQSPEVAEAIRVAKAAGVIVIEPTQPAYFDPTQNAAT